jgi:hypothetical protein
MFDLRPGVLTDVPPAEPDLLRTTLLIKRQLTQTAYHPRGQANRDSSERTIEMLRIQLTVQLLQSVEEAYVSRPGPVRTPWAMGRGHIRLHRKSEELSFRSSAEDTR